MLNNYKYIYREDYNESCLPSHPCLRIIANCEQVLSKYTARRLLTFEKISNVDDNTVLDPEDVPSDFREKYFNHREETRKERKLRRLQQQQNHNKR